MAGGVLKKKPGTSDCGLQHEVSASKLHEASEDETGWQAFRRRLLYGDRLPPVPSFRGPVEPLPKPREGHRTGICCSGGGIRSAAFNLGALQVLQEREEFENADYLAGVSGGSYICAALAMVANEPEEDKTWQQSDDSDPSLFGKGKKAPFARNSPEEQYLRNRSSYMASDGAAKIYLGVRLTLGLLVNVLFLAVPVAIASIVLGLVLDGLWGRLSAGKPAPPWELWAAPAGLVFLAFVVAAWVVVRRPGHENARKFSETWSARIVIAAVAFAVVFVALPALAVVAVSIKDAGKGASVAVGAGGSALGIAGLLAGVFAYAREAITALRKVAGSGGRMAALMARVRKALPFLAAAIAGPLLFLIIAAAAMAWAIDSPHHHTAFWIGAGGALFLWVVVYLSLDITSMSLHPFYKRRLCSAFALRRVPVEVVGEKRATAGIGQDTVGVAVERNYEELLPISKTHMAKGPQLIVCAAANVSDPAATPPGRQVTSFTFSSSTVGGPLVGAMDMKAYEDAFDEHCWDSPDWWKRIRGRVDDTGVARWVSDSAPVKQWQRLRKWVRDNGRARDFSLPAAVAMSGAALSPSMGKETRHSLRFLLALANIRLGVWVPNPRWAAYLRETSKDLTKKQKEGTHDKEDKKERRRMRRELGRFGRPRPGWLIKELFGSNRIDARYLYVSDGGHYENLGLVELLRRGCTRVFCFDASGGEFAALGDALALARSELGVEIEIDPMPLLPKGEPPIAKRATATGTIRYPDGEEGVLIYARNVMPPDGPWDVRAYQLDDPAFPHNSTADQLYTDQRFEAYRALGTAAAVRAVERMEELAPLRPRRSSEPLERVVSPERVKRLFEAASVQLVDVREQFGWDVLRIEGVTHIEHTKLTLDTDKICRDYPVIFHCGDGRRSREVAEWFRTDGWPASSMGGGIARWIADDLPVNRQPPIDGAASNGSTNGGMIKPVPGWDGVMHRVRKTLGI
jgi:rhodanese-related sulfurtransferase